MKFVRISKALVGIAVLALTSAVASADVVDKKTILTVKETIEVPGAILPPGEYVLKVIQLPSYAKKHVVQITNKEETEVLSTVIAVPNTRLKPTGDTTFEWHEMPAGQPPALKAWFYPGDSYGQEFAYPENRAMELAAATNQEVPRFTDDDAAALGNQQSAQSDNNSAADRQAEQRARERELAAQQDRDRQSQRDRELAAQRERDAQAQSDRERQLAQATQNQQRDPDPSLTAQQNQRSTTTENELPETAGLGVLLALIGLGSFGASRAVRKLRK